jgi:hypothetical protein
MIVNRAGELLLANKACELFFDGLPPHLLEAPVNTRRIALHPEGLAARIANFDAWAPHVTESLRRELTTTPTLVSGRSSTNSNATSPTDLFPPTTSASPSPSTCQPTMAQSG